ncbi:uncharacterized protein [Rutidosis leptorrhynchoides]|uniref:uncharacterized protein n=1 Tax=Rutidosis leptorrhynchoides TaxID=125765 RepID=UPI003A9A5EE9
MACLEENKSTISIAIPGHMDPSTSADKIYHGHTLPLNFISSRCSISIDPNPRYAVMLFSVYVLLLMYCWLWCCLRYSGCSEEYVVSSKQLAARISLHRSNDDKSSRVTIVILVLVAVFVHSAGLYFGMLRVVLPRFEEPPPLFKQLLQTQSVVDNIHAYNQMFSMTSFGARVDDNINEGRSPYVFKVSRQIYHWIGSLCPQEGCPPRFLQLYIYDTAHEVENRMSHFGGPDSDRLCSEVVSQLVQLLDRHNKLVKLFCTARDKCAGVEIPTFKVFLFKVAGSRQHALPSSNVVGVIVFDTGLETCTDYDVIIEPLSDRPRRINKLHPLYMSLQYPLMFFFGELGFHPRLMLRDITAAQRGRTRKMSMNMFYSYQLHDRSGVYSLMLRLGRLFQQYVVTVYCSIELDRMDYIRMKHQDIRNEYLTGLHNAINRGDRTGADVGSRTILPASFTGGPRYMFSHYLDAVAICRVFASDRADIIARVFHSKVEEFVTFLKQEKHIGSFRGKASGTIIEHLDDYISAELPDPRSDPVGYAVISATMMHGPCGLSKTKAPCMEGYTSVYTTHSGVELENSYVVPYNRLLSMTFQAHINVECCGCTSFEDSRTVNEVVHHTYRSACEAVSLLGDDKEWATALEEASASASSSELRSLFSQILGYFDVTNPLELWEKHWKLMADDIPLRVAASLNMPKFHINDEDLHNYVLYEVKILLNPPAKSISEEYGLPDLPPYLLLDLANWLIME